MVCKETYFEDCRVQMVCKGALTTHNRCGKGCISSGVEGKGAQTRLKMRKRWRFGQNVLTKMCKRCGRCEITCGSLVRFYIRSNVPTQTPYLSIHVVDFLRESDSFTTTINSCPHVINLACSQCAVIGCQGYFSYGWRPPHKNTQKFSLVLPQSRHVALQFL